MGKLRMHSGAAAAKGYRIGYPGDATNVEPNVACQFVFSQSTGGLVDTVSGVTLASSGGNQNTLQVGEGDWFRYAGVLFNMNGDYYSASGPIAAMGLGTGNFTIEYVMAKGDTETSLYPMLFYDGTNHGYELAFQDDINKAYFYFEATDGTAIAWQQVLDAKYKDGKTHHHRLVASARGTGSAQLEYFIDGASQGTTGFTSMNGKTIPAGNGFIGYHSDPFRGTLRELRVSNNATNNSYGFGKS